MEFYLAGPLERAVKRSIFAREKTERIVAAAEVARLLREGAPLTDGARETLARLFAGEYRPKRGRPPKPSLYRIWFRHEFEGYYGARKPVMGWEEALEEFAEQHGVKFGTAKEWVCARDRPIKVGSAKGWVFTPNK